MNGQAPRRRSALLPLMLTVGSIAALLTTSLAQVAHASGTCRVRNHTTGVAYPGSTGPTFQVAIHDATFHDVIVVRGRCVGSFEIRKGITVVGKPRAGFPIAILDGNRAGRVLDIGYRQVHLRDLRITRGLVDYGGGIRNSGTLTLNSVIVNDNKAKLFGGGIVSSGDLTLMGDTRVNDNAGGTNGGGGIYSDGILSMRATSRVSHNRSSNIAGGIYNGGQLFMYRSSRVSGNVSGNGGGGIYGSVTMYGHARITGNTAGVYGTAGGGGVLTEGGPITLNGDARINRNHGVTGGGICVSYYQPSLILVMNDRSTVVGNTARDGGGICIYDGAMQLNDDARVSGNTATRNGGGVWMLDGELTMSGSATILGNVAEGGTPAAPSGIGGGIRICNSVLNGATAGGNVTSNLPDDIGEC